MLLWGRVYFQLDLCQTLCPDYSKVLPLQKRPQHFCLFLRALWNFWNFWNCTLMSMGQPPQVSALPHQKKPLGESCFMTPFCQFNWSTRSHKGWLPSASDECSHRYFSSFLFEKRSPFHIFADFLRSKNTLKQTTAKHMVGSTSPPQAYRKDKLGRPSCFQEMQAVRTLERCLLMDFDWSVGTWEGCTDQTMVRWFVEWRMKYPFLMTSKVR